VLVRVRFRGNAPLRLAAQKSRPQAPMMILCCSVTGPIFYGTCSVTGPVDFKQKLRYRLDFEGCNSTVSIAKQIITIKLIEFSERIYGLKVAEFR
jgi:hypothetical protein